MSEPVDNLGLVADALRCIDAHDRDVWIRCGMAIKSGFGDPGYAMWEDWSRSSDSFSERAAEVAWRSFTDGAVGIGTLFYLARRGGWRVERPLITAPYPRASRLNEESRRSAAADSAMRASVRAAELISTCATSNHLYLEAKGFPDQLGLVAPDGRLILPIRDTRGRILGVQLISESGDKRFLAGSKVRGGVFRIGRGSEVWLCEGYATGLTLAKAARSILHRRVEVVVCFSSGNIPNCVSHAAGRPALVVADGDAAGRAAAEKTHLPWWAPDSGDANDAGAEVVAKALRSIQLYVKRGKA